MFPRRSRRLVCLFAGAGPSPAPCRSHSVCTPWGLPALSSRTGKMIAWLKRAFPDFFLALVLTGVALLFFLLSFGTSYHQLAIGLLASAVSWVLLILMLESAWRLVTAALRYLGIEGSEEARSGR